MHCRIARGHVREGTAVAEDHQIGTIALEDSFRADVVRLRAGELAARIVVEPAVTNAAFALFLNKRRLALSLNAGDQVSLLQESDQQSMIVLRHPTQTRIVRVEQNVFRSGDLSAQDRGPFA